jgi:hypothetical protein
MSARRQEAADGGVMVGKLWSVVLAGILATGAATAQQKEIDLASFERTVFSQRGEDGVLEKIFEIIEPGPKYVVEFGSGSNVNNSNSRNLTLNHGWSGLLMDGNSEAVLQAKELYKNLPRVRVEEAWIYPGNVEILFERFGVPVDLDLLVIDIDSNDYYVWRVLHGFRPKVVQIEFNANFAPPQKAVVEYHPLNYWDKSDYFGASIQSLYELGKKKGYELVYCNKMGTNLFFVDKHYFERFGIRDNSPERLYRSPRYGLAKGGRAPNGRGHPPWDTFEITKDGRRVMPYNQDLIWNEVRIKKRFVSLPP